MSKINIYIMRHSITKWNELGKFQGQKDSPLTRRGIELAKKWKKSLPIDKFDKVVTSDLGRAIETAKILIGDKIQLSQNKGLREQDWGDWTGLTIDDINKNYPNLLDQNVASGWDFMPPNGESRVELLSRSNKALEEEARLMSANQLKNMLCVCHEGTLKAFLYDLANHNYLPQTGKLVKKKRFHIVEWDNGFKIKQLNCKL